MSQPEKIVPATSKIPTTASSDAAVVGGMPWSCAAATKCVPIRPLVDMPQIANPPASSQKVEVRVASRSVRSARATAPPATSPSGWSGSVPVAPYAVVPTSAG